MDVDFPNSTVKGRVKITLKGWGKVLSLDSAGLKIGSVKVNGKKRTPKLDEAREKLVVPGIPKGESVVEIAYSTQVSDASIFGLYKSKYDGDHLLVTDLEPTRARTVFPCVDDPAYKAVFRLSVTTDPGLSVISNPPLAKKADLPGGRTKFTFEPSPKMSTYLFFLGVGHFEESSLKSRETEVIVASKPGQRLLTGFALQEGSALVREFGRYFGTPYPLKKLHLLALPEYHTGAMENWGAITFREVYLLLGDLAGAGDRIRAAHIIAHEIAHMWFGDLVTMKWWDDLWLNESFATFMDFKAIEALHPEWDSWREFLRRNNFSALNLDAVKWTHPVQVPVLKVEDIENIFDEISYGKGASLLRMFETFVGEEAFRKGVSEYIREFAYSNARGEDLWSSLGRASKLPVSKLAKAWLTRPGFPMVKVEARKGTVKVTQSKFALSKGSVPGTWPLPLRMEVDGRMANTLLEAESANYECADPTSVLVNPRRTGFYITLYDDAGYEGLAKRFGSLHPHDRAGLLGELYLFMQAGMVDPSVYFRFVSLSARLVDPAVTPMIIDQLTELRAIADESALVSRSVQGFYESQMNLLGLAPKSGEGEKVSALRESVAHARAKADESFAKALAPRFSDYDEVDPSLKGAVAVSFAVAGGKGAFGTLLGMVKKEKSEVERGRLYSGMTAVHDPQLVVEVLELPFGGEVSRSDFGYTLRGAVTNPRSRDAYWEWLKRRYDDLRDVYGGSQQFYLYMNSQLPIAGVGHEAEVKKLISGKRYEDGELTFRRTFELLEVNTKLRRKLES